MFLPYIPAMCTISVSTTQPLLAQGIQGLVIQLSGNYMPRITTPTEARLLSEQSENGVQTKVWIFSGRISGNGSPQWSVEVAADHPSFVRSVESNSQGRYSVVLPVGEYTVFAQYEDMLYLNAFQGDGSFKSVTVNAEEIVNIDLVNTEAAVF